MTPFQVNPQVSELLNKFEKNIDALDLMGGGDPETDNTGDRTNNKAVHEQNGGERRKKRPPPMLIPIAAVIKFSEQGPDSVSLADCLVGTPTDDKEAVCVDGNSTEDTLSERTIQITPLAAVVSQVEDLTDEFVVEELPPSESSQTPSAAEEEAAVEADPSSPPPLPSVEKESKKRKVEPAPKVERVKRKRTTMSMKKDED
jgi:hypothetical protein